jgi:hypothetical protein
MPNHPLDMEWGKREQMPWVGPIGWPAQTDWSSKQGPTRLLKLIYCHNKCKKQNSILITKSIAAESHKKQHINVRYNLQAADMQLCSHLNSSDCPEQCSSDHSQVASFDHYTICNPAPSKD